MLRPVFVIGPPRCGTTLLRDLLALHPEISGHGEDFHRFHHDLTLFRHRAQGDDHFRLTTADALPEVRESYERAVREALSHSGASCFVLKISTLSIQVDYLRALFPGARFVQIVRDGRDAACSTEDLRLFLQQAQGTPRLLGPAPDPLGLWCASTLGSSTLCAAASWAYHVARSYLDLQFAEPEASLRIRYEDLLQAPRETLETVMHFVGLPSCAAQQARLGEVGDVSRGPGDIGFSSTAASAARVGRFETDMSASLRVAAALVLEAPMRLLGYQPDPWPTVEEFFPACEAMNVNPEVWRDKAKQEVSWFDLHRRAFAPERNIVTPRLTRRSRPLLIDGAALGHSYAYVDGRARDPVSWVQKQERRSSFADPEALWPRIAGRLNGTTTLESLTAEFGLTAEHYDKLEGLIGMGFVGLPWA